MFYLLLSADSLAKRANPKTQKQRWGWRGRQSRPPVVGGSEHGVVVRSRLRNRLDHIPMLYHLAVFRPV